MPEVRDGTGKILCHLGTDGNAIVGDLGGDDKEEVAIYSTTTVNIYAASQFDYTLPAPTPGKPFKQTKFYGLYSRYGSGDVFETGQVRTAHGPVREFSEQSCESILKVTGKRLTLKELGPNKSARVTLFNLSGKVLYRATVRSSVVDIVGTTGKGHEVYVAKILYDL
jgi:hypothetical protein